MSDMIDRAVKAAEDYLETDNAYFDREESIVDWCVDLRKLVTAIIASMRNPTPEMITFAVADENDESFPSGNQATEIWLAMIDAALANPDTAAKRTEKE